MAQMDSGRRVCRIVSLVSFCFDCVVPMAHRTLQRVFGSVKKSRYM